MNARKHNLSGIVAMAIFAVTLGVAQIATAQPQALEGWPIDIEGWFAFDTSQWSGPVIADLDPSEANGKEVIFADTRRIFAYTAGGGAKFNGNAVVYTLPDNLYWVNNQVGFRIYGTPSVGDVNGDGVNDIAFTCIDTAQSGLLQLWHAACGGNHNYRMHYARCYVFVLDGTDGDVLDQSALIDCDGRTPVLADLDTLGSASSAYEDGRMEVVIAGWSNSRDVHDRWANGRVVCDLGWQLSGDYYATYVLKLEENGQLVSQGSSGFVRYGSYSVPNRAIVPAVGDMNGDGKKEIAFSSRKIFIGLSYNPSNQGFAQAFIDEPDIENAFAGFYTISPVLGDWDNNGSLEAVMPFWDGGNGQEGTGNCRIHVMSYGGEAPDGEWLEFDQFDGSLGRDGQRLEALAFSDFDEDGDLELTFHRNDAGTGFIHLLNDFTDPGAEIQNFPKENEGLIDGIIPSVTTLTFNNNRSRVWVARDWSNADVHGFNDAAGNNPTNSWAVNGAANFSSVAVSDLDDDGDYEVAVSSRVDGTTMRIGIFDIQDGFDPEEANEMTRVEWSQLGNSPRHAGLYAQTYSGWLPSGTTYFRDRVIIADDVHCSPSKRMHTTHRSITTIEFNEDAALHLHGVGSWIGDVAFNLILRGNTPDAQPEIVFHEDVEWPPDWPQLSSIRVIDGSVIVEPGAKVVFENWHFYGADASIAVTADSANVTFLNCTFEGYSTALSLYKSIGSVKNCTFENVDEISISLVSCTSTSGFTIENCTFDGSGNAAIYAANSTVNLNDNTVTNSGQGTLGAAVYAYNSTLTMKNNDVSGNELVGLRATGGGSVCMTDWLTTYANRISNNLTATHVPKTDSTWAEMIQVSPTYAYWGTGHNDFISANGDYLIASHAYSSSSFPFNGSYNYYNCNDSVLSGDFYPSGSVNYLPSDYTPNHTSSIEEEESALALFRTAKQAADSGNANTAIAGYLEVVSEYPGTAVAPSALRAWYDLAPNAGRSEVLNGIIERNGASTLGKYAFRLVNLNLVQSGDASEAIENLEAAMGNSPTRLDSLYYAIDCAYAELAQIRGEGNRVNSAGNNRGHIDAVQKRIERLLASLNGRPTDEEGTLPTQFGILEAFPNPFNGTVALRFGIEANTRVRLSIHDMTGREVSRLLDDVRTAGKHQIVWNANGVATGIYVAKLEANGRIATSKLTLVK